MGGWRDRSAILLHLLGGRQSSWCKHACLSHDATYVVLGLFCCHESCGDRNTEGVLAMGRAPHPGSLCSGDMHSRTSLGTFTISVSPASAGF